MTTEIKKNGRKWACLGAGAALLAAGSYALVHGRPNAAETQLALPVAVAKAVRGDLSQTISVTGDMRPNQQIDLHAKVAGYLQKINVDIGDHVKEGDVIAVLEIPELNEEVESARAATEAARQAVKSADAKYREVHLSLQRLQEVAKKNPKLIAQQDLDDANSRDLAAAADLALAGQHVAECRADQNRVETMVKYATITAPFDGVITRRFADPGALIQAGISSDTQALPVVSLAQDSVLRATFPLPESIVARMEIGDPVQIQVPALGRTLAGKVSRFSRHVERATRTMEAQIDVPNPGAAITPGMYAVADFDVETRRNVLTVPVMAVKTGAEPSVFTVNARNQIEKKPVKLGLETPDAVEVDGGLKAGDLVVIGNTGELRDGMPVAAKEASLAESPVVKDQHHG